MNQNDDERNALNTRLSTLICKFILKEILSFNSTWPIKEGYKDTNNIQKINTILYIFFNSRWKVQ